MRGRSHLERLRILAAAAALGTFTVAELVAYSGANENTVRSVLERDAALFSAEASPAQAVGPGRPPARYRVVNTQRIAKELRSREQQLSSLAMPQVGVRRGAATDAQGAADAASLAEDALARALASEPNSRER